MKQTFSIIILLLLGLIAQSQPDSVRGKQFQLTGKLIGQVRLTPHCGSIAWGTVLEFEMTNIEGMAYKNKSIRIVVTCPEFYGKGFFKKGGLYTVIFSDTNQADFSWAILNKDLLKMNHLSFDPYATTIKPIP